MTSGCFTIAGVAATTDATGALYVAAEGLLVVADLHLEKGSSYAERRVPLPPYDTAATLAKLALAITRHAPRLVVALGDSFHDRRAAGRMAATDRDSLRALQVGRDWIWIAGNHDPAPPEGLGGEAHEELRIGSLVFRHEPRAGAAVGEVAGHLHPVARVRSSIGVARRRCCISDGTRCVLPAFGAYAGGLNIRDEAFDPLFGDRATIAHVLGRQRVYRVPMGRCVGD